jgi:hypothetical protein
VYESDRSGGGRIRIWAEMCHDGRTPLHGLSLVLSVGRRRIISLEIVILDTFMWSALPDESFQSEPCPPLAHGHFI